MGGRGWSTGVGVRGAHPPSFHVSVVPAAGAGSSSGASRVRWHSVHGNCCGFFAHPFPPGAPAGAGTALSSVESLSSILRLMSLLSPSRATAGNRASKTTLIEGSLLHLSKLPFHVKPSPGVLDSCVWLDTALATPDPCTTVFSEAVYYPLMTAYTPHWIASSPRHPSSTATASHIFGTAASPPLMKFPWNCEPEMDAKVRVERSSAFNGELKTAGDKLALQELAQYVAMGMVHSLFPPCPMRPLATCFTPPLPSGTASSRCRTWATFSRWSGWVCCTLPL